MTAFIEGYSPKRFPSKKAFKQAVKDGEEIRLINPTPFGDKLICGSNDYVAVVGPDPYNNRKWFAACKVRNGRVTEVK